MADEQAPQDQATAANPCNGGFGRACTAPGCTGRTPKGGWLPGHSGNTTGAKRKDPVTRALQKLSEANFDADKTYAEELARVAYGIALGTILADRAQVQAIKLVIDYPEGKPVQRMEIEGGAEVGAAIYEAWRIASEMSQ